MGSWDQLLGMVRPQATGPAPTPEQRAAYEAMAQRKQGPMARMIGNVGSVAKGAIVDDPMMPQAELQSKNGWEQLGMLMGVGFVPPGARRLQSLKVLNDVRTLPSLSGWTPEAVSAITQLHSTYPNTFAHVEEFRPVKQGLSVLKGMLGKLGGNNVAGKKLGKSVIELNTNNSAENIGKFAAHELTHAAQRIRNPKGLGAKYDEAEKIFGYEKNPYEVSANKAAANYARRMEAKGKK